MLKWQVVAQTREQYRGPDSPSSQSHHAENQSLNAKLPCKEALRSVVIAPWQKHTATHSSQFSCCQPSTPSCAGRLGCAPGPPQAFFCRKKDCTFSAEKISAKMERMPPSPSAGSAATRSFCVRALASLRPQLLPNFILQTASVPHPRCTAASGMRAPLHTRGALASLGF